MQSSTTADRGPVTQLSDAAACIAGLYRVAGCDSLPEVAFTEAYESKGITLEHEELACAGHAAEIADRLGTEIGPPPDEGAAR